MFWVVQNNLYNEYGYHALMEAIERRGIPHVVVKPVPIINHLLPADFDSHSYQGRIEDVPEPFVDDSDLVMVCGAVTLAKIGAERGWKPGSFLNENFDYPIWKQNLGDNLLNHDAVVCRFDEVNTSLPEFFIRPCEDTKSFSGKVYEHDEFYEWKQRVIDTDNDLATLKPETMVMYSSPKKIYREYRFFVVNGNIVTGSQYKLGNRVLHDTNIDPDVVAYAQQMVDLWQPALAFVIDIALTPEGCKVIEINNFNSAGFYASDVGKIVDAIENMEF